MERNGKRGERKGELEPLLPGAVPYGLSQGYHDQIHDLDLSSLYKTFIFFRIQSHVKNIGELQIKRELASLTGRTCLGTRPL